MKNILIFLFMVLLLFNDTFAGCFRRDDIASNIKIKPNTRCIDTDIIYECTGKFELLIGIKCNKDFFVTDQQNQKINVYSGDIYPPYNKVYKDYTIPQNFTEWERKLVNKENPNDIIYIKGRNQVSASESELDNGFGISKELFYIIILLILLIPLFILYKKF